VRDRSPQSGEAGGFVEAVEGGQDGAVPAVDGLDPYCRVLLEPAGHGPVGGIELSAEHGELRMGVGIDREAVSDLAAGGLPGCAVQELRAGVAPAAAAGGVDVAATQRLAKPLEDQEGVGGTVQGPIGLGAASGPRPGRQHQGHLLGEHAPPAFQVAERSERGERVRAAGSGLKLQRGEQGGQEPAHRGVSAEQVRQVGVDLRAGRLVGGGDRRCQLRAGHLDGDRFPDGGQVALGRVQQHRDGVAQVGSGDIEGGQGPQPVLPAGPLGPGEQGAQELVEKVQRVVGGRGLQVPGRRQQRGVAPHWGHPGHGLRLGGGRVPGQRLQPARRHGRQVKLTDPQGADLGEAGERAKHPGGGDAGRASAQPVQPGAPVTDRDGQQARQRTLLRGGSGLGQGLPQRRRGSFTDCRDQAGQHSGPREQNLALEQPGGREVEQRPRALGTQAGPGVQPPEQIRQGVGVGEVGVAVSALDLPGVLTVGGVAPGVALEHPGSAIPSWEARCAATAHRTSVGSGRNVPRYRTVHSCTANPSRLCSPRRMSTRARSLASR